MGADLATVVDRINGRYLLRHPASAARRLESLDRDVAVQQIAHLPPAALTAAWPGLGTERGAWLLTHLPPDRAGELLATLLPTEAVRFLGAMDEPDRGTLLDRLPRDLSDSLRELMVYPEDTAGRLMNRQAPAFRGEVEAALAMDALRRHGGGNRPGGLQTVFVLDADLRLAGQVSLQALALAAPDTPLRELMTRVPAAVHPTDARDEVVATAEKHRLADLPVVDLDGRMVGAIAQDRLVQALQEEAAADIGAMVGVSPQERALSRPGFAVRKRLPWLQINLLTAFLAAAVVGLFESTIAQFTALAVLLPVVAGQSGNAGAQALAVTMRGLALREITVRQWFAVTAKEVGVGLINGAAVALTCGIGVWIWSQSLGLVLVIVASMVLAMVAAGFAGAVVPMLLTRLRQDPAQSSSIILTTVTDVAGFFSFLGIATLLSGLL